MNFHENFEIVTAWYKEKTDKIFWWFRSGYVNFSQTLISVSKLFWHSLGTDFKTRYLKLRLSSLVKTEINTVLLACVSCMTLNIAFCICWRRWDSYCMFVCQRHEGGAALMCFYCLLVHHNAADFIKHIEVADTFGRMKYLLMLESGYHATVPLTSGVSR